MMNKSYNNNIQTETIIPSQKTVDENVSVSIILALQNSEDLLDDILDKIEESLHALNTFYEIICIDDGSEDGTADKIKQRMNDDSHIKLIKMRSTFGEASALDAGLKEATGERILYLTSRVRINPLQVRTLLQKLEDGFDVVVGWRYPRRDSILNRMISKLFNFIINRVAKLRLHDINSGILAARKEVFENVSIYGDLNHFIPVLAVKQGFRVSEEKIEQLPGKFRKSRYISEYIRRFLDIITVIFLTRYSKKPIHFLGFVGAIFTIVGLGINLYLFFYRILLIGPIAGRPLLLLGALLLIIGIQMVSIGLIGEMIIFTHAKEVKEYNIEEIVNS